MNYWSNVPGWPSRALAQRLSELQAAHEIHEARARTEIGRVFRRGLQWDLRRTLGDVICGWQRHLRAVVDGYNAHIRCLREDLTAAENFSRELLTSLQAAQKSRLEMIRQRDAANKEAVRQREAGYRLLTKTVVAERALEDFKLEAKAAQKRAVNYARYITLRSVAKTYDTPATAVNFRERLQVNLDVAHRMVEEGAA